jgi:transposase-like protein
VAHLFLQERQQMKAASAFVDQTDPVAMSPRRPVVITGHDPISVASRHRYPMEIILLCVRWYCRDGASYRELADKMQARGLRVDHATIFRWVRRYASGIAKDGHALGRPGPWQLDESCVRVDGQWMYLFRAMDGQGRVIDLMLSDHRNMRAVHRFLGKAVEAAQAARLRPVDCQAGQGRA